MSALQIGLGHLNLRYGLRPHPPLLRDAPITAFVAELWRSRRAGVRVLIELDDDPTGHADFASGPQRVVPALRTLLPGRCVG